MTLTRITSDGITDGTVVNADINASAAIAGTKVSPDFGSQNISTTGILNSGNLTITGAAPSLFLTESDSNPDYQLFSNGGKFKVHDVTNSADRLTIDSSGRVGIGTASPSEPLHINSASTLNGLLISSTNNNTRATMELNGKDSSGNEVELRLGGFGDTSRGEIFTVTNHSLGFATNNAATQMVLDTSGRVGIGTTSPNALLDVNGQARFGGNKVTLDTDGSITQKISNSTTRAFMLSNTDVSADFFGGRVYQIWNDGTVMIGGSAGTNPASYSTPKIQFNPVGNSFFNASGGNVGIGTTSPDQKLKIQDSSDLAIHLLKTGSQDTLIKNTGQTEICAASGGGSGQRIAFKIGANTGSLSDIAKFTDSGLCFGSDTAAANALDDYEEGSWTPNVQQGDVGVSGNSSRYVKIGNVCTVSCSFTPSGSGSASASVIFGNLPFQSHSSHSGSASIMHNGFDESGSPEPTVHAYIGGSSTNFLIYYSRVNGSGWQTARGSEVAGHQMIFNITYPTS